MTTRPLGIRRHGVTLAELLVVIVILGLIGTIAVHAFAPPPREGPEARMARLLMNARAEAIKTRRSVVVRLPGDSITGLATALPDGSIVGESRMRAMLRVSRLTGEAEAGQDSTGRD